MNINTLIRNTLADTGFKLIKINRKDFTPPCIIYHYTARPSYFTDNSRVGSIYTVTLNIFVKEKLDETIQRIISIMEDEGFVLTLQQSPYLEDSGYYNCAVQMKISLRKEDELYE